MRYLAVANLENMALFYRDLLEFRRKQPEDETNPRVRLQTTAHPRPKGAAAVTPKVAPRAVPRPGIGPVALYAYCSTEIL